MLKEVSFQNFRERNTINVFLTKNEILELGDVNFDNLSGGLAPFEINGFIRNIYWKVNNRVLELNEFFGEEKNSCKIVFENKLLPWVYFLQVGNEIYVFLCTDDTIHELILSLPNKCLNKEDNSLLFSLQGVSDYHHKKLKVGDNIKTFRYVNPRTFIFTFTNSIDFSIYKFFDDSFGKYKKYHVKESSYFSFFKWGNGAVDEIIDVKLKVCNKIEYIFTLSKFFVVNVYNMKNQKKVFTFSIYKKEQIENSNFIFYLNPMRSFVSGQYLYLVIYFYDVNKKMGMFYIFRIIIDKNNVFKYEKFMTINSPRDSKELVDFDVISGKIYCIWKISQNYVVNFVNIFDYVKNKISSREWIKIRTINDEKGEYVKVNGVNSRILTNFEFELEVLFDLYPKRVILKTVRDLEIISTDDYQFSISSEEILEKILLYLEKNSVVNNNENKELFFLEIKKIFKECHQNWVKISTPFSIFPYGTSSIGLINSNGSSVLREPENFVEKYFTIYPSPPLDEERENIRRVLELIKKFSTHLPMINDAKFDNLVLNLTTNNFLELSPESVKFNELFQNDARNIPIEIKTEMSNFKQFSVLSRIFELFLEKFTKELKENHVQESEFDVVLFKNLIFSNLKEMIKFDCKFLKQFSLFLWFLKYKSSPFQNRENVLKEELELTFYLKFFSKINWLIKQKFKYPPTYGSKKKEMFKAKDFLSKILRIFLNKKENIGKKISSSKIEFLCVKILKIFLLPPDRKKVKKIFDILLSSNQYYLLEQFSKFYTQQDVGSQSKCVPGVAWDGQRGGGQIFNHFLGLCYLKKSLLMKAIDCFKKVSILLSSDNTPPDEKPDPTKYEYFLFPKVKMTKFNYFYYITEISEKYYDLLYVFSSLALEEVKDDEFVWMKDKIAKLWSKKFYASLKKRKFQECYLCILKNPDRKAGDVDLNLFISEIFTKIGQRKNKYFGSRILKEVLCTENDEVLLELLEKKAITNDVVVPESSEGEEYEEVDFYFILFSVFTYTMSYKRICRTLYPYFQRIRNVISQKQQRFMNFHVELLKLMKRNLTLIYNSLKLMKEDNQFFVVEGENEVITMETVEKFYVLISAFIVLMTKIDFMKEQEILGLNLKKIMYLLLSLGKYTLSFNLSKHYPKDCLKEIIFRDMASKIVKTRKSYSDQKLAKIMEKNLKFFNDKKYYVVVLKRFYETERYYQPPLWMVNYLKSYFPTDLLMIYLEYDLIDEGINLVREFFTFYRIIREEVVDGKKKMVKIFLSFNYIDHLMRILKERKRDKECVDLANLIRNKVFE